MRVMDGRGGCCIARYAGGGGGAYHTSKMDQIMLRFRPIAPKPASGGSVSGGFTPDSGVKIGRCKRKYVKESSSSGSNNSNNNNNNNNNNNKTRWCNKRRKVSPEVVTLPLLPESPERKDSPSSGSLSGHLDLKTTTTTTTQNQAPIWLNFDGSGSSSMLNCSNNQVLYGFSGGWSDHRHRHHQHDRKVVVPQAVKIAGSCVTVERVTDTWTVGDGMGSTDEERVRNLARDTCPGFVSDGLNRVTWTNGAYKKFVKMNEDDDEMMMVWLVMKERVPVSVTYPAFTCRVRVQYTCRSSGKKKEKEKRSSTLTLPCDVWRMDGGGFAWRLDVKAALSLGR